jgi:hypothetical protein
MVELWDEDRPKPYSSGGAETVRLKTTAIERYHWSLEALQAARAWIKSAQTYYDPPSQPGEPTPECAEIQIEDAIADVEVLIKLLEEERT